MANETDTLNPLPDSRRKEINTALGMVLRAKELMRKAKECGVDVTDDEMYFDTVEAQFDAWKSQFFANKA